MKLLHIHTQSFPYMSRSTYFFNSCISFPLSHNVSNQWEWNVNTLPAQIKCILKANNINNIMCLFKNI